MNELEYYLSLPWTLVFEEHEDDGLYYAVAIGELPGFIVAAETPAQLADMFWPALEAHLLSYLDHGETPPIPESSARANDSVGSPATFADAMDLAGV